jgi:LuxR family maltose regulon positive regulatory protein
VAWLALDAGDSDPHQFLRYLIAALQSIAPAIGGSTLTLLRAAQAPAIETLLPLLLNDLVQLPEGSILILDDYHAIDSPEVHRALTFLVEHLPPQLHLVIASRADPPLPLSRLRARGQLTELRAHDLRFTADEVATFLSEVMGLTLSVEDMAALEARTEGWIAGLQLAALSLRDRPDAQQAEFIEAFTGSNRFVVDYLVGEVLARQPPHLQTFLLQTSILERLCGSLCDAVVLGDAPETPHTAHTAQRAYSQLLLEELERNNLFIVPLDDERRWYRYHQLFAQVLRHRLESSASQDTVATLHSRASVWFEQHGLIDNAVRQAFAASDLERVTELIECHALALMERSEDLVVRRWMEQLPPRLVETRPRLAIVAGWLLVRLYRVEALEQLLQTAMRASDAAPVSAEILGQAAVLRATAARVQERYAAALASAHEALALLPADLSAMRAHAMVTIGVCLMHRGDIAAAEVAFDDAAAIAQSGGSPANAQIATYWLSTLYDRLGRLGDKLRVCEEAIRASRAMQGAPLPYFGKACIGVGEVWYERNELERAQQAITDGLRLLNGSIEQYLVWLAYVLLAQIHQARGAGNAAMETLEEAEAWAVRMQIENRQFHEMLAAYRARIWLRQGNLTAALQWAATCTFDDELRLSHVRRFTLIRVRLAYYRQTPDRGGLDDLASLAARLLTMAEEQQLVRRQIELLMLQALVAQAQGNLDHALNVLERTLTLAAPEGYLRLFVDEGAPMAALLRAAHAAGIMPEYVARLLAAFPSNLSTDGTTPLPFPIPASPSHKRNMPDVLTERELEVLRLLAVGHSNQAIAQQLIVAIGTIKRHVNSILSKLGVQSRLQAVARARKIGLV